VSVPETDESGDDGSSRRIRADARRNRERLLAAAHDAFVDQGLAAPLEDIARRAGVGIATLYRRFPDRHALMREVALQVLTKVAAEARTALAEQPDAFLALGHYLHRALDLRIAAVMPILSGEIAIDKDDDLRRARDELGSLFETMVNTAQRDGLLRADIGPGDIGLMTIRLARPLPLPVGRTADDAAAHRHLNVLLDGLRATRGADTAHAEPAHTLDDLRRIPTRHADPPADPHR
jgi:AcrR family transcriptional regulator